MTHRRTLLPAVATTVLLLAVACAPANTRTLSGDASFQRPVDMVIPFGAGGGADQVGRAAGSAMEDEIDQQIPVVNVPGATGSSGMTNMLSSRPGESMAVLIQDTLTTVPAGSASFATDELRAVCRLQSMPSALMVRRDTYEDWQDLADAAQDEPGELTVATVGANSVDDIVLAALAESEDTQFRPVPYSEPAERYAALLGGGVDILYEQLGDVTQYLDSGDFVPLLMVSDERVEGFEDVPTVGDLGLPPEVVLPQFRGLMVSADAGDEVVAALSEACEAAVATPELEDFQELVYADADSFQDAEAFQEFLDEQEALISEQLKQYGMGN
ncbi:tripartite tricarboxylate transporter substrate binding protein [Aeromicrobium sp. CF4.19]|uniref:tripartite tricarboxylate transporter substrate binding protein n=1 Tax=Aeromicrobium sp. CF4.19 TaxID=3373082 RepID=UPI003EE6081C